MIGNQFLCSDLLAAVGWNCVSDRNSSSFQGLGDLKFLLQ